MQQGSTKHACLLSAVLSFALIRLVIAQPERNSLLDLAEHYQTVSSASLSAEQTREDGLHLAIDMSVDKSGAFAALHYGDVYTFPGLTWDERPWYFVYFDGKNAYSASDGGSSYTQSAPEEWLSGQYPPPVHQFFAPWPVISKWAQALASAGDTTYVSSADQFSARSVSLGIALRWDDTLRVHSVFRGSGSGDAGMEIIFERYDAKEGRESRPTRMRQIIRGEAQEDGTMSLQTTDYVIKRFEFNLPDIAERVRFDAKTLQVNRFDRETSNVYSPDGDLLFNKDEFYQAYLKANSTRRLRPWMIVVFAGLVIGSGYVAYKRFGPKIGTET